MIRKILLLLIIGVVFLFHSSTVFADEVNPGEMCIPGVSVCQDENGKHFVCQKSGLKDINGKDTYLCGLSSVANTFGTIQPPDVLKGLLQKDPTGAGAISQFLSNFVILIYTLAAIVLILMILWGAFDWLISEGDKEKVASAQKKIINAVIGIILFAVAFAIIQVLGQFTGFTFFKAPLKVP